MKQCSHCTSVTWHFWEKYRQNYILSFSLYLSVFVSVSLYTASKVLLNILIHPLNKHTHHFLLLLNIVCSLTDFHVSALCASFIPDQLTSPLNLVPLQQRLNLIWYSLSFLLLVRRITPNYQWPHTTSSLHSVLHTQLWKSCCNPGLNILKK